MAEIKKRTFKGPDGKNRCFWCESTTEYMDYHDREWGFPVKDDRKLFEKLSLEGFQAGLSWRTILVKRENFREAFVGFDFEKVARFNERDIRRLLKNEGIVRHRGKIEAVINNAQKCLELIEEEGSLAKFAWSYEPSKPRAARAPIRSVSDESKAMSKELKKRGWKFVGPTTVYSFMQAMGLVNDHFAGCEWREKVEKARAKFRRP